MDLPVAEFWERLEDGRLICQICPHNCHLVNNQLGKCGARQNMDGTLKAITYGLAPGYAIDPIEKKPLYHFLPGSTVLSLGHNSCNLTCQFCQNWEISQQRGLSVKYYLPAELVRIAQCERTAGIAFTYTEPTTWFEYIRDVAPHARATNLKLILVTNGYMNAKPMDRLLDWIDAANLDIKSFDTTFYHKLCGGSLKPVLETAVMMSKRIHLEITYLMIPEENDAPGMVGKLAQWMAAELGKSVPLHISRYRPAFHHRTTATPIETLMRARNEAKEHLSFVYVGNYEEKGLNDTLCPNCSNLLIARNGYSVKVIGLDNRLCGKCGYDVNIVR